jgi:seryl-tRNA synthetase
LTGIGAMLEFALVNYAISSALKAGFTPVIPPVLVNPAAMEGTGFLGQAAENVYHLEKDDVYLVGTSEVPLAAMHMDEVLPADILPMRYAGYSSCFRREAGTYGKDTRGIIRVHQFDKVEMFSFCHPDQAKEEHERLLQWEKVSSMQWRFHTESLMLHQEILDQAQTVSLILKPGFLHKRRTARLQVPLTAPNSKHVA